MKQINLNTEVSVRLTDKGANQLVKKAKTAMKYDYHFDQSGNLCIKLIGLMQVFGEEINDNVFFYDDTLIINEKEIEEYKPKTR